MIRAIGEIVLEVCSFALVTVSLITLVLVYVLLTQGGLP